MKRKDFKALYRAYCEIETMCHEALAEWKQCKDDPSEVMRGRFLGLLDAKDAIESIITTKNKK
jgi:hypothetical protein